jgi:hypothetical protein
MMGNKLNRPSSNAGADNTQENDAQNIDNGPKKDQRGRLELVNPNLKEILDNNSKKKQSVLIGAGQTFPSLLVNSNNESMASGSRPASHTKTAYSDNSNASSQPISRNSPTLPMLDTNGSISSAIVVTADHQSSLGESPGADNGYRLVRSINRGHLLSKKEWKGTSGKIGRCVYRRYHQVTYHY